MNSGKNRYSPEVYEFAKENVSGHTTRELAIMISEHFGFEMTESKMRAYKKNHKLKGGLPTGKPKGQGTSTFPQDVIDFIKANHKGNGHQRMADLVNEKFGTGYTKEQIKSFYGRHKLNSGLNGRFEKGHVPYNKGKHPPTKGRMGETQFKKGHLPHNTKPIGYERISRDGYIEVKVKMRPNRTDCEKNFVAKHRLVWEQANGPIPKGYNVIFKDGDKRNFELENLALVSDAELAYMTTSHLRSENPELTETGILIARAAILTKQKGKEKNEKHRRNP